ncbi:THUMP domain-containing class I SAM-dependent RNA methyltransferase [Balneola vulgaris]|jgi:putative N6-adenine-specific DNA methylase|uniref:THUMP domain-containing class I SAM-dependent RNA methyltransferase n=1 Tax=Balneola vulgaris TaxID=287535 RepID=UPI00036BD771|nr:class I SAM-dependent RNA methyltransferase [Balneola vulgaris]
MADFHKPSTISITCPKMISPFLKKEVEDLGFTVQHQRYAGVELKGSLHDCMKLNLCLSTAHRVHYLLKTFTANNADELHKELVTIPWEDYIDKHGYVSITSFIKNKTINNTQFANLKVKDAIVDRIREKTGSRPDSGSDLNKTVVFLFWKGTEASIYLDTSGESISRRGYRVRNHTAPMQETLASTIIQASKWKVGQHFINPMCGSGTLAIEAALMALGRPAGLLRPNYGIKHILGFDVGEWNSLRSDLKHSANKDFKGKIIATDIDNRAIKAAQKNAQTAGVDHLIEFHRCDFQDTPIPEGDGVVVFNPPYGERIGHDQELYDLYKTIGDFFKQECSGKWGYVFTGNFDLAKKVGLRTSQRIELYNSTIECRLLEYELY